MRYLILAFIFSGCTFNPSNYQAVRETVETTECLSVGLSITTSGEEMKCPDGYKYTGTDSPDRLVKNLSIRCCKQEPRYEYFRIERKKENYGDGFSVKERN